MSDEASGEEYWRQLLTGESDAVLKLRRAFGRLPSPPRCKLCQAPFRGPLAPLLNLIGYGPWALNRQLCRVCLRKTSSHHGGAELEVTLVFSDVRGSTTLGERLRPAEFRKLIDRFFNIAFKAVDAEDGVVDHIAGDGVMAMWIPGFAGPHAPARAVSAARSLTAVASEMGIPVGTGVHTGVAFVGIVGGEGAGKEFTVLGDTANTAARVGSAAAAGEALVSGAVAAAAEVKTEDLEHRQLALKGKAELFDVWVLT